MSRSLRSKEYSDFISEIARTINRITGVQLTGSNISQVESKVTHRMLELGLSQFQDYEKYYFANYSSEVGKLITLLTTHYTYFFREFSHFEFLASQIVSEWIAKSSANSTFKVWSAACSRGQECYSLAMALQLHLRGANPQHGVQILGTDIDPESVEVAKNGVYRWDELKKSPSLYLANHWMKGTGSIKDFVRAKESIRNFCQFEALNLINPPSGWKSGDQFDVIFCRNVLIYFDPQTTKKVIEFLLGHLKADGYLIIGLSESLHGLGLEVDTVGPSVYQKVQQTSVARVELKPFAKEEMIVPPVVPALPVNRAEEVYSKAKPSVSGLGMNQTKTPRVTKVLCVDDSKSVLKVLEKVFSPSNGFEIVGQAMDGIEANRLLEHLKPDVITLDIHMPNMDGLSFLESRIGKDTPPVVMLTSVSRESQELAGKAFALGARDFIEKPSFQDFDKRVEEICSKLRMASQFKLPVSVETNLLNSEFQRQLVILQSEKKLRVLGAGVGDREKLSEYFKDWPLWQSPTIVVVNAVPEVCSAISEEIRSKTNVQIQITNQLSNGLLPGKVYLCSVQNFFEADLNSSDYQKVSSLIFTGADRRLASVFARYQPVQILVEDPMEDVFLNIPQLPRLVKDYVPETSFRYMSDQYLSEV